MFVLIILSTWRFDSLSIFEQSAANIHAACSRLFDMSSYAFNYGSTPTAAIIVIGDEILSGRTKDKILAGLRIS